MTYNKPHPHYPIGTKAFMASSVLTDGDPYSVVINFEDVVVRGTTDGYDNIVVYEGLKGYNGAKSYRSSTHWSNISTDKADLIYKFVGHSIDWCVKNKYPLENLVNANKKTDGFKEAYNLFIELNAERFI